MLNTAVGIISPSSLGGGLYSFNLHFSDGTRAKYLRVNDTIQSGISTNQYRITTWSGYPTDFTSGNSVTVEFITVDVIPPGDSGFNSIAFTPNQTDKRPYLRTEGTIGSISVYSGQNYEYQITASWSNLTEANKSAVGDSFVDSTGKEYTISHLTVNKFADPFRAIEREKVGIAPTSGTASLYRSTDNLNFFQGNALSDPARTNIRNRDLVTLEEKIQELESMSGSDGSSTFINLLNSTGSTIAALTPVSIDANGKLQPIDVSTDLESLTVAGVTEEAILNGAFGKVVLSGRILDINSFDFQDVIYVSKTGTLTADIPEIGVNGFLEGDFVIKIGVVAMNEANALDKDLIVATQVIGVL